MTLQFFRYGSIGSVNVLFSWSIYFAVYNYILRQQILNLGFYHLSGHMAALVITFPITNIFGFVLQKYITFTESDLKSHVQLYRYFIVAALNFIINTIILKTLVDLFHFWTTPSQMVATCFCIFISYISQKKFTFK